MQTTSYSRFSTWLLKILSAAFAISLFVNAPVRSFYQDIAIYDVYSLAYSPDGTKIAVGGGDPLCSNNPDHVNRHAIQILDATSGELIRTLIGHNCAVTQISWKPDSTQLVSVSDDGTARVWDVSTGQVLSVYGSGLGSPLGGAVWSPDGNTIGSFLGNGATLWDPNTGNEIKSLWDPNDNSGVVNFVWKPDNTQVALVTTKEIYSTDTIIDKIEIWDVTSPGREGTLLGKLDVGSITALAWSPDGNYLAGGGNDGPINIFDPATGQTTLTLPGHVGGVGSIAWSRDGTWIASGGGDSAVRVWDVTSGQQIGIFTSSDRYVTAVAWSPHGNNIVYGGNESGVEVQIVPAPVLSTPAPTPITTPTRTVLTLPPP